MLVDVDDRGGGPFASDIDTNADPLARCEHDAPVAGLPTAGVSLFSLASPMGTGVDMIDRTYGHLAPDAESYERELLDAFDAKNAAFGQLSGTQNP